MNRYKYNEEKTKESLNKLENNQITLIGLIGIIICITLIFLGITIAQTSMIKELYDEYKPIKKECECNCNNELIIDTDTMTL